MKLKTTIGVLFCILSFQYSNANTYFVTTNADDGAGSLRQAITDANTNAGKDTIHFNIPASDVAGRTITLLTSLPALGSPTLIDGTSQPNGNAFGVTFAKIQVTTSGAISYGISILADSCEIYGLAISNFETGILVQNPYTKIGAVMLGNVIYNCSVTCIKVQFTDHVGIQSDIIGLDTAQAVVPGVSGNGIEVSSSSVVSIGGKSDLADNVISGNNYGVLLSEASFVNFNGNHIGCNSTGLLAKPNQYGIYSIGATTDVEIGGDSAFEKNVISGNFYAGIYGSFKSSVIQGNLIGLNASGTGPLGNGTAGIYFTFASSENIIGGDSLSEPNIIAYNGQQAIAFQNATCHSITITHNSIYCNSQSFGSGGIDTHFGNGGILPPQLLIVNSTGIAGVTIPNGIVEFYYDDSCNWCEGKTFFASVTAGAGGAFIYNGTISQKITATVTDTFGNTSEFGPCVDSTATVCIIGDFGTSVPSGCPDVPINFIDQSITAPGSTVTSWQWDFGDGSTSTDQSPDKSYSDPDVYTVQLIVTNSNGCSDTVTKDIIVNEPPAAQFQAALPFVCLNDTLNFTDQSYAGYNATLVGWDWNFDDGGTSTDQNPIHVFTNTGNYDVMLTVTNSNGCTNSFIQPITVLGAPSASFTTAINTLQATFTNTSTTNGPSAYSWNFGDGSTSTSESPVHDYSSFGVYTVCLTVYDSTCSQQDSICQTVDIITGITDPGAIDELIMVSPNPASNFITLSHSEIEIQDVRLLNVIGEEVWYSKFGQASSNSAIRIDLPQLASGIYLVKIETDKGLITKKLTIDKQ